MNDLTNQMQRWRDGELSNYEILRALLDAQCEVYSTMLKSETLVAEERAKRLFK